MALTASPATARPSLAAELLSLSRSPAKTYPRVLAEHHVTHILFFSAVSGVYVAYVLAERLRMGDHLGFVPTLIGVVFAGAGLGLLALSFTVWVLSWSTRMAGGSAELEVLGSVFGHATWPFLPLLCIIVPVEIAAYGTALFSASRPAVTPLVPVLTTTLEAATILFWLYLMVRGEAVAAEVTEMRAARTIGLTFLRMAAIAILLVVILFVSFLI
jgi:hypothetical protein